MRLLKTLATLIIALLCFCHSLFATKRTVPVEYSTIQSAINACTNGDTVEVASGTYVENINFNGKQIMVRASGLPGLATIDGNHVGSTVTFTSGETSQSVLEGFKIINGDYSYGGGIYLSASSPVIRNCIITANYGFYHSGIGMFAGSNPRIEGCLIFLNTAFGNGAVGVDQSSPTIVNCTIASNHGDAIYAWNSSNPNIYNNILAFNSGYGIYRHALASPNLAYNCVYGDTAGSYYNMSGGASDFSSDPLFANYATNDFRLTATSPCINAGNNSLVPSSLVSDLDYNLRIADTTVDVGAFEYGSSPLAVQLALLTGKQISSNIVLLEWTTVSEQNNYGFYVEHRMENEPTFTELPNSFVPGAGTTLEEQQYRWTDNNVTNGIHYYRLQQVDMNGDFTHSHEIQVVVNEILDVWGNGGLPPKFALEQNYPNPFNPTTTISYDLAEASFVSLKVFDVLGREIATLVNEHKPRGSYHLDWNASSVQSGLYFVRMTAGGFSDIKKIVLIK